MASLVAQTVKTRQVAQLVKNPPANAGVTGDMGLIPGSGRYPGEGDGNQLHYFCLENSLDRGAYWATVHGVTKSQTRLSTHALGPMEGGKTQVSLIPSETNTWAGWLFLHSTSAPTTNPMLLLLLLSCFSCVWLCATPQMAAHQAPPILEFSRQEYWNGLPFPSPVHESEKWKQSRSVVSDSSQPTLRNPMDCSLPGSYRVCQINSPELIQDFSAKKREGKNFYVIVPSGGHKWNQRPQNIYSVQLSLLVVSNSLRPHEL